MYSLIRARMHPRIYRYTHTHTVSKPCIHALCGARARTYTNIVSTPLCLCRTNSFGAFPLHAVSLHPSSAAAALPDGLRVIRALRCTRNSASKSWYVRTRLTQSHPPQRISFSHPRGVALLRKYTRSKFTRFRIANSWTIFFFFYFRSINVERSDKNVCIVICHRLIIRVDRHCCLCRSPFHSLSFSFFFFYSLSITSKQYHR